MKINGDYLEFTDLELNKRSKSKIGGHAFAELLGLNEYATPYDALLTHFYIVEGTFDERYRRRGEWAEKITAQVMKKRGKNVKLYNDKNYYGDCFGKEVHPVMGGVIDVELPDDKTLVEVKSKSLSDLAKIEANPPKHEVIQGLLYGYLKGYEQITMMWIFFDPVTEQQIFDGKPITSFKNIKKLEQTYTVNRQVMEKMINKVIEIRDNFLKEKKIALAALSPKMVERVKKRIKEAEEKQIYHVDFDQFMEDMMKPNSSVVSALSEQNPYVSKDEPKNVTITDNKNVINNTNVNGGK